MPLFGQMTGIVELEKIFCIVIVEIIIQFESVEAKKKKNQNISKPKKGRWTVDALFSSLKWFGYECGCS